MHGTGLGVLRSDTDMSAAVGRHARRPAAPPSTACSTVTKADARSPVHRRGVAGPGRGEPAGDGAGSGARQHRFVGLFPSAAYTSSVLDVPLVRRAAWPR